MPVQLIVMGVSGCGKSTLGAALAHTWGVPFIEGDALHAPDSVAKMAAGIALVDADRWPWLDRIGDELERRMTQRPGHYMPPALLDSQLRTLERPVGETDVLVVDGTAPVEDMVAVTRNWHRE